MGDKRATVVKETNKKERVIDVEKPRFAERAIKSKETIQAERVTKGKKTTPQERVTISEKTEISERANKKEQTMTQEIDKLEPNNPTLELVLANRKDEILKMGGFTEREVARFIATALSSVSTNEKLRQCSLESVVLALYDAARCGLAPNSITQEGHLVPYYSSKKRTYECKFITGYRGIINMIYATGTVSMVDVTEVFEHDEFIEKKGSRPEIHHLPKNDGPRGKFIGAYAVITDKNSGLPKHHYCSEWDGEQHRDRYGPKNKKGDIVGPWISDFPAMVMKTALKKVSKYCATAPATQRLFEMIRREEMQERPPTHVEHPEIKTPQELTDADLKPPVMVDPDTGEVIPDEITKDAEAGKNKELFNEEI